MKKNTAIVFGLTINHIAAVACVMMDLRSKSPDLADEVVIFCDKYPPKKDIMILNTILPVKIIKYNFPIKDTKRFDPGLFFRFSKMVFTKFECLKLLNDYKNVIWLDYDLIIQKDISELINPCEQGIKLLAYKPQKVREQFLEPIEKYDMERDCTGLGTFVVQDNLKNYMELYNFCYTATFEYAPKLFLMEQGIIDIMLQEYNLDYFPLDRKEYVPHLDDVSEIGRAKIFHAAGIPKFWNGLHNENWNANYQDWLKMGGSVISERLMHKRKNLITFIVGVTPRPIKKLIKEILFKK